MTVGSFLFLKEQIKGIIIMSAIAASSHTLRSLLSLRFSAWSHVQLCQRVCVMTGVYQHWCSSTFHIRWGLCDCVCQVFVCRGRYGFFEGVSSLHSGIEFGRSRTGEGSLGGRKRGVV
jgi:hypothetical protein